jgi:hypothetical protein
LSAKKTSDPLDLVISHAKLPRFTLRACLAQQDPS